MKAKQFGQNVVLYLEDETISRAFKNKEERDKALKLAKSYVDKPSKTKLNKIRKVFTKPKKETKKLRKDTDVKPTVKKVKRTEKQKDTLKKQQKIEERRTEKRNETRARSGGYREY